MYRNILKSYVFAKTEKERKNIEKTLKNLPYPYGV